MVQIENEYGSYGNDRDYMARLKDGLGAERHRRAVLHAPTARRPTCSKPATCPARAIGLDSGSNEKHWELARSIAPGVPVFSSETYPGWLTHWGEKWARPSLDDLKKEVAFLLGAKKSFNFYVLHGGTNFGFTAGANSGGKGYEPDVTSYDYDAPDQRAGARDAEVPGAARDDRRGASRRATRCRPIPDPIPTLAVPEIPDAGARVALGQPARGRCVGAAADRSRRTGRTRGSCSTGRRSSGARAAGCRSPTCTTTRLVFVDGKHVGTLDRRLGEKTHRPAADARTRCRCSTSSSRAWATSTSRRR